MPAQPVSIFTRWRWRRERPRLVRDYLASTPVPKLHLGSGTTSLPEWLNTDLRPGRPGTAALDVRKPFPFEAQTVDFVFAEHLIEHLSLAEGIACLGECLRVLRPGGRIRVATPSLERLAALFGREQSNEQRRYVESAEITTTAHRPCSRPGLEEAVPTG